MRFRRALLTIAIFGAPALALVLPWSGSARGDDAASPATQGDGGASGARKYDPDNRTAIAEWMEKCVEGNKRFLGKDVPGAIDSYRQATQLAPKQPLPQYLLAEAQLAAGNVADAEASLKGAESVSSDKDANVHGKILFLTADVKERAKKWDEAKAAWQAYADFAAKHADAGTAPTTPPARVQAIDDMLKQDKAYEAVRQRIAENEKDAGPADAGKKK